MLRFIIKVTMISTIIFSQGQYNNVNDWTTNLYKNNAPAVTIVISKRNGQFIGYGSGFNVHSNGLVVTNYHVVAGSDQVIVQFKSGNEYDVEYYAYVDIEKDFALLNISGTDLPVTKLGNSNKVKIGSKVAAIGNPKGAWGTITDGLVSQKRNTGSFDVFQTNVFIAPGSSGGPLFNKNNKIIGITTAGLEEGLDINYALPINYVRAAIKSSGLRTAETVGFDIDRDAVKQIINEKQNTSSNSSMWHRCIVCMGWYLIYQVIHGLLTDQL